MSKNVDTTRRWFEEVWNGGRLELVDEILAPNAVLHDSSVDGPSEIGPEEFKAMARALRHAIPDLHISIEDVFSSRGRVAARLTVTGTHAQAGLGIEPTHREIRVAGITIARLARGRVVEAWNSFDLLTLFDQLGALKRPVSATPSL